MTKKIAITGSTGFVGSNVATVLASYGYEVLGLTRKTESLPWETRVTDLSSSADLELALSGTDAVIHAAIQNDFTTLIQDRDAAFDSYVETTARVARAANLSNSQMIYISTDWIFDGEGHLMEETDRGNPVNFYGYLKAMGEQVVRDLCPQDGAVCRISGVMGRHQTQPNAPRSQDVGFGFFVYTLVEALQKGQSFQVWSGPRVNNVACPSLAAEIGAQIERVISKRLGGTFHLVGDEAISRWELALLVCEVFKLDRSLLSSSPPPEEELFPAPVPVDSSMSNLRTKQLLGLGPTSLVDLLQAFKRELETGEVGTLTKSLNHDPNV
jgi:dTDP-4-dehydrorhamnose reductase